jgi:hypothetical protein
MHDYDVYALVDDTNTVLNIVVGPKIENDVTEQFVVEELSAMHGGKWLLTGNSHGPENIYRKNYAGIGYKYDKDLDAFIPPKPYLSWILNKETAHWEAPVQMPFSDDDHIVYVWNEEALKWDEIDISQEE